MYIYIYIYIHIYIAFIETGGPNIHNIFWGQESKVEGEQCVVRSQYLKVHRVEIPADAKNWQSYITNLAASEKVNGFEVFFDPIISEIQRTSKVCFWDFLCGLILFTSSRGFFKNSKKWRWVDKKFLWCWCWWCGTPLVFWKKGNFQTEDVL